MCYKVIDDKLLLFVDNVEAGYIQFNKTDEGIEVLQTYVYPGFRENGYAKGLVKYMTDNYDHQIYKVNCSYYRIMAADYKLSKIAM